MQADIPDVRIHDLRHTFASLLVSGGASLEMIGRLTPDTTLVFDVTNHPSRIYDVEALRGKAGYLVLKRLQIESYEREEYLLFSGFNDNDATLDQETMEKLFSCSAKSEDIAFVPQTTVDRLEAQAQRHAKATISLSLEQNSAHFHQAREKLEKWADDMVLSAEKALADTKEQIKALRREARQAVTLEEQHAIQQKQQKAERQQRRQRQEIFAVEDDIIEKRDTLIDQLERRLTQQTETETLFMIRWMVI